MWLTHDMACVNMHGTFEGYKYGVVRRRGEQQEEKGMKKKEEGKKGNKERKRKEREMERGKKERTRRRGGKRKEPAGFPPTDDASTDGIHQTEKQSSSTQRQLRVGAKGGGFHRRSKR